MLGSSSQRIGVVRSYPRKSQIILQDDPANHVYEVVSGTVCTWKMLRKGRRQISGFYFSGDVFGLENAKKQNVAAQAITNAKVRVIKKQALTALASSNREVADQLLALTAQELTRKQDHLLSLLSTTAEERILSSPRRHGPTGLSKGRSSHRSPNVSPGYCGLSWPNH